MPHTKIKVKVAGLLLDEKDCPVLELKPVMEANGAAGDGRHRRGREHVPEAVRSRGRGQA
jgi:hypothetical protein